MTDLNSLDRVLTSHGYAIKKTSLTPRRSQNLRKDLTVAPITNSKFQGKQGQSFTVYTESPTRFYVPRAWAKDMYGPAEAEAIHEGTSLRESIQFIGKPYDYQKGIVDQFISSGGNGLICVPCGRGKTFMAIWTAMRIGKKFLIVVDKEFLLQQWRGELESLVPGIHIGILQEDKCEVGEEIRAPKSYNLDELKALCRSLKCKVTGTKEELIQRIKEKDPKAIDTTPETYTFDCTIAMIQTLVQREFPANTFKEFGFTIFDECHHLGAAHFSRALLKVQTKHMLGLSATPIRDDGLTKVFEWFLGKPVYWEKTREADPHVIVRLEQFKSDDPEYNNIPTDYKGEVVLARLLTKIVECKDRNVHIANLIKEIAEDSRRRILVLSERINHLEAIEALLITSGLTMGYYIGGMKEEVRESGAQTARVLLASYAMASEAMNIKTLNTVILASPRKKVEQSTGRILRIQKNQREVSPLIVDIVDNNHGMYQGQWRKRAAYYKLCGYKIQLGDQEEADMPEEQHVLKDDECCIMDD